MTDRDENLPAEMARWNWIILAALVLLSLIWHSLPVTLGVLGGGLVVIFNYHWMGRSLRRLFADPLSAAGKKGGSSFNYLLRLVVIGCAIYLLLVHAQVHPLGLIAGLSVVVLNLLLTTLKRLY